MDAAIGTIKDVISEQEQQRVFGSEQHPLETSSKNNRVLGSEQHPLETSSNNSRVLGSEQHPLETHGVQKDH
jgi:hypothetical protein